MRLDRPVDQIALDRINNKRVVTGNNKTALDNPQAVEAKLEKELFTKRMIRPFLGPSSPHTSSHHWDCGRRKSLASSE